MRIVLFFVLLFAQAGCWGQVFQGMDGRVFSRVVEIKPLDKHIGTAFFVEQHDTLYLITAKHVLEDLKFPSRAEIKVRFADGWHPHTFDITYSPMADIAVLKAPESLVARASGGLSICETNMFLGQDLYFLGFPYDSAYSANGLPGFESVAMPFIKRAIYSGGVEMKGADYTMMVLDGINNPGFSGGPVVHLVPNTSVNFCVCGVVISYKAAVENVISGKGLSTSSKVSTNSGLMYALPASLIGLTLAEAEKAK